MNNSGSANIAVLLAAGEGPRIDFKHYNEAPQRDIAEQIVAFANAGSG